MLIFRTLSGGNEDDPDEIYYSDTESDFEFDIDEPNDDKKKKAATSPLPKSPPPVTVTDSEDEDEDDGVVVPFTRPTVSKKRILKKDEKKVVNKIKTKKTPAITKKKVWISI